MDTFAEFVFQAAVVTTLYLIADGAGGWPLILVVVFFSASITAPTWRSSHSAKTTSGSGTSASTAAACLPPSVPPD